MKKFLSILIMSMLFSSLSSYGDAYRYKMEREPCNKNDSSFYVCRPYDGYTTCSVSAQTLCPGYGMAEASIY
ncbi:hypothetical protein SAMN06295967_107157 [Belliella buryatensis]|uniref:Uncharacterized protein n=1 Tax=Belliella buryatensis TaxID=1500549 RepID=A0A239DN27_9BACT|nr:hypothetical protein SAMN06295967_107157 [Belliella buryatensis]